MVLHFNSGHTTDFGQHTEIILQDIPKHRLTLGLFLENEERELQRKGDLGPSHTQVRALSPLDCVLGHYSVCTSRRVGGVGDWLENARSVIPSPVRVNPNIGLGNLTDVPRTRHRHTCLVNTDELPVHTSLRECRRIVQNNGR